MALQDSHTEYSIPRISRTEWISLTVVSLSCWLIFIVFLWMYAPIEEYPTKVSVESPSLIQIDANDGVQTCEEIDSINSIPSIKDIIPLKHIVEVNEFPDSTLLFQEELDSSERDIPHIICECVDPIYRIIKAIESDIPIVVNCSCSPDTNSHNDIESEPVVVNMNDIHSLIEYPQAARDAGISGQVVVRVLVDKRGRYVKHKVINQVHPILSEAVERHIPKLVFTPAIQGGRPIKFWVNIPFNFHVLN